MANTVATSLFSSHPRNWQDNQYVYPVLSRRSNGLSIGVNLNPDKICNFDCVYCQVDRSVPADITHVDLPRLSQELDQMLKLAYSGELFEDPHFAATPPLLRRINDIAFSGDGEPTTYRQFDEVVRVTADLKKRLILDHVKIVVISNATQFHREHVQRALPILDENNGEIWAKLDAGTDAYYHTIAVTSIPLQTILDNIFLVSRDRPVVIQSLFMNLDGAGPGRDEIDAYVKCLAGLLERGSKIKLVQVYTVARPPAQSNVTALDNDEVDDIVRLVQRELGLQVLPYYGLGAAREDASGPKAGGKSEEEKAAASDEQEGSEPTQAEPAAQETGTGKTEQNPSEIEENKEPEGPTGEARGPSGEEK